MGLPVIDIAALNLLIASGELDGRVAAVRGYWIPLLIPSCPAPGRWYSPLEDYCSFEVFSDIAYAGGSCVEGTGGTSSCQSNGPPPNANIVKPKLLDNYTSYGRVHASGGDGFDPRPVVLIGHAGDPRYRQCLIDVRDACRHVFVVDTVAWAGGDSFDVALPDDPYEPVTHEGLADVERILGTPLISIAVVAARDTPGIDPRIRLTGTNLVWVARTLGQPGAQATAYVEVVDDATGDVLANFPLHEPADYQPALVRTQALDRSPYRPNNTLYPMFRITTPAGAPLQEGIVGGGAFTSDGKSFPGAGVLLDPGDYVIEGWHTTIDRQQTWGVPSDECQQPFSVTPGQQLRIEAAFPVSGPCVWRDPTFPDSLY